MRFRACNYMGLFWGNDETEQEEGGELENISAKLKQNLSELECEEAIIKDKERYGRVRNSVMKVLRAKNGNDVANRALSRVNKRVQENYFTKKRHSLISKM